MFIGILVFSVLIIVISVIILMKYERLEKAELASYLTLSAWGSLLYGIFIARISN